MNVTSFLTPPTVLTRLQELLFIHQLMMSHNRTDTSIPSPEEAQYILFWHIFRAYIRRSLSLRKPHNVSDTISSLFLKEHFKDDSLLCCQRIYGILLVYRTEFYAQRCIFLFFQVQHNGVTVYIPFVARNIWHEILLAWKKLFSGRKAQIYSWCSKPNTGTKVSKTLTLSDTRI